MVPYCRLSLLARSVVFSSFVLCAALLQAQDVWNAPSFSVDSDAMRRAASDIQPSKDSDATILLSEFNVSIDSDGKVLKKRHIIYRIESQEGVEGWSEVRGNWEPWYQAKPEIKARVITPDGAVHPLDPATLNDVPVHENAPDLYSDERALGGPLPALTPGAIVEDEVINRDTSLFFSGGNFQRYVLARNVPVQKTRFVLSHPESVPVHYVLHRLDNATVTKKSIDGIETITVERGPMDAVTGEDPDLPSDVILFPEIEFATGASWQRVATEYSHQLEAKLRVADVQPVLSHLNLSSASRKDKIRKITAALHKDVRYTGIEFGESSLIPQFPAETLKRKYGDCKDKATLLIAMLRAAGIPANLALLSAGPGEDVNPDLPGMGVFDHAIVYVPAADSNPELWIDATAQYSQVGDLPEMDYGRWALVVDEKTTALKKIPELTADKNIHIETREFALAEYGPASIVERNQGIGPYDANYRDYYSGDAKKIRQNSEEYVKNAYLADSLASFDKTDPSDLDKPFVVTLTAKGRRGFTDMDNAVVYIPHGSIFTGLPEYFLSSEKEDKDDAAEDKRKPRTVDWSMNPFTNEWRYKIVAPPGFKIRALPPDKDEQFGTARFSQKYSSSNDGAVVEATLRFESGKSRLTVSEAVALRDAVVKARSGDGITIAFDQVGYSLASAGQIREALTTDRRLVAEHPKDALQRVRLALVLLAAGLGEKAQAVAKEAAALDPNSVSAFSELGWILEHDQIGRRFGKGFDYQGAIAAYRKAKQLDPKDDAIRANLAILLEYSPEGERYGKNARMEEAIQEFKDLKKLDEDYARSYQDYIPYDLWYLGRYKEVIDYVNPLPATDSRRTLLLASVAALDGPQAAIRKSLEITSQEEERSKALSGAGWLLVRVRKYPQAADLLTAGAAGQKNEANVAPFVALLRKTKPREELTIDDSTPAGVIQKLFMMMFLGNANKSEIESLMSRHVLFPEEDSGEEKREFDSASFVMRSQAENANLSLDVMVDIVLSNAHYSTDGDDALGFRITMQTPGAAAQDAFVVREDGHYRIVTVSVPGHEQPESIGWEVLARLQQNDLAGARKWLDWARDKIHIYETDDPLSGRPFPHFWTKGQQGDEAAMRLAAIILLPSKELQEPQLAVLIEARNNAKTDAQRNDLNLVLAYAYAGKQKWTELQGVAAELVKASPDSFVAYAFAAQAYAGLKKFDDWEKLLQPRLQSHPDDREYIREASRLAEYRSQFKKSRELLKGIIDRGSATANDLNEYAWDGLYTGEKIDQDSLDAGHRASDLTKNASFSILHTVACLYAVSGKTKEAREFLLKAMKEGDMPEPDSAVWLGLALIAEQYGETDAARAMYARVEKDKVEHSTSNYSLAQMHLASMKNTTAKSGGQ